MGGFEMSLCGICGGAINDGYPLTEKHLGYDGCEEDNDIKDYLRR